MPGAGRVVFAGVFFVSRAIERLTTANTAKSKRIRIDVFATRGTGLGFVIPAQAGIQPKGVQSQFVDFLDPRLRGDDEFLALPGACAFSYVLSCFSLCPPCTPWFKCVS